MFCKNCDFYPRPPGGGRPCSMPPTRRSLNFYPRPPGGGRQLVKVDCTLMLYFYPRPPGGGRHLDNDARFPVAGHISIHALRVEGDIQNVRKIKRAVVFLSTPSGWRATATKFERFTSQSVFLSTPSGWRATPRFCLKIEQQFHFYPRPPGGGRQQKRTKFSSVFAQKGEEFASLRRGKRKICRWRFKKDKFWVLIWCEGSGKSVCALASHCG